MIYFELLIFSFATLFLAAISFGFLRRLVSIILSFSIKKKSNTIDNVFNFFISIIFSTLLLGGTVVLACVVIYKYEINLSPTIVEARLISLGKLVGGDYEGKFEYYYGKEKRYFYTYDITPAQAKMIQNTGKQTFKLKLSATLQYGNLEDI